MTQEARTSKESGRSLSDLSPASSLALPLPLQHQLRGQQGRKTLAVSGPAALPVGQHHRSCVARAVVPVMLTLPEFFFRADLAADATATSPAAAVASAARPAVASAARPAEKENSGSVRTSGTTGRATPPNVCMSRDRPLFSVSFSFSMDCWVE